VAIVQAFHQPPAPEVADREFGAISFTTPRIMIDNTEFENILPKLSGAAKAICHHEPDITLVLDKGNNAKDTWELLYVGYFLDITPATGTKPA
jgi:hypothetical protein